MAKMQGGARMGRRAPNHWRNECEWLLGSSSGPAVVEFTYQSMIARGLALSLACLPWRFKERPIWLRLSMTMT
jgi:hypothetical protein